MNIDEAKAIFNSPQGHTKEELAECLVIMNTISQPIELSDIQFEAIVDAHRRLGLLE